MSDEREERILDEACELIVRYGYDKTSVSEIAAAAGVSKGAIYLHFAGKEDLFEALLIREIIRHGEVWLEHVEEDPRGGTIGGLYRCTLKAQAASPLMQALLQRNGTILGSYLYKKSSLLGGDMKGIRSEFVEAMQKAGVIRDDVDPKVAAYVMDMISYGMIGLGEIREPGSLPELEPTVELIAEMLDLRLTPREAESEKGKEIAREMTRRGHQYLEALREKKRRRDS